VFEWDRVLVAAFPSSFIQFHCERESEIPKRVRGVVKQRRA